VVIGHTNTMSFGRDKAKDHQRALRAFAESEDVQSGSEGPDDDGLDIIESSRKGLDINLSQYIDGQSMLPVHHQHTDFR
jgi:hypothetical protein